MLRELRYGNPLIFYIDPVGVIMALLFCGGIVWGMVAHLSLIGELKRLGVEVPILMYGQMFFLEFEYLGNTEVRSKKLDFLARSSLVATVSGPALAALVGVAFR